MITEKNRLKVLDKDDIDAIHGATIEVLEKVGIRLELDAALDLVEKNGFEVDRKARIVRMGESAVAEAVKSCVHNFHWHARSEKHSFDIVDGRTKFGPGAQCLSMIDPDTEKTRPSTLDDAIMIVKLLDSINSCSMGGVPVYFHDVPPEASSAVSWMVSLANSSKISFGGWGDDTEFELMMRVADVMLGDREQLRKKVFFPAYIDPISPLAHDKLMLQTLLRYGEWNMPVFVMAMALAGGTAPISLAGLLVQQNAEILSTAVISKCVCKHPSIVYGSVSCPLDMRSGISATGSPEFSLLGVGAVQLAKHYRLPSDMGVQSDSKTVDAQTSYEKVQSALMAVMARSDMAELSLGSTEAYSAFSLVQLMIDDEIVSNVERIARGIEVTDETLSVDIINKVGPMGSYLKHPMTMKYFRKEHSVPKLSDRATRQQWTASGSKDIKKRARERANALLLAHAPEPLEPEVAKGFNGILMDYAKGYDLKSLMACTKTV
jgi:trimethylamine:corrinoid methyltransferase-like protein